MFSQWIYFTEIILRGLEDLPAYIIGENSFNIQSPEADETSADVPQHLGPTLFLLYINDLPSKILRSLLNISADDTAVYECISKSRG